MKKLLRLVSLLGFAFLMRADFQLSAWKYRRPIPAGVGAELSVVTLDRDVYVHSRWDLADLRIAGGSNEEIPYVLERVSGSRERAEVSGRSLDQGVTQSGDLELTVEVGPGKRHNGVRLSTTRINFRQRVSVSTSDDGRQWLRVRDDGYIFDFSQAGRQVSVLDVEYTESTRRFVRLTVYGWKDPKAVTGCYVMLDQNHPPARDNMATLAANPSEEAKTQSTVYTWDLGTEGVPHDQLSLVVDTPAFQRAAAIESSRDGKEWSALGLGVVSRFKDQQSLELDFPESHERYLRLRLYNRDDRPLAVKSAILSVIRSRLKFKAAARAAYWLYYGNPEAHPASYDLRDILAREAPASESAVTAGAEERNLSYREKPAAAKPWSEQHPGVLFVTLAIAVAGMGIVTVRFLKRAAAETNPVSGASKEK